MTQEEVRLTRPSVLTGRNLSLGYHGRVLIRDLSFDVQTGAILGDVLHLLYGNLLAVSVSHAVGLVGVAMTLLLVHVLFARRFLLVTFDPEAAHVAGVKTRVWSLGLHLMNGIAAAAAVHEIGGLLTFALLTLPAMAALLLANSIRFTFLIAGSLGTALACSGVAASYYFDLPAGPAAGCWSPACRWPVR